MSSSSSTSSSSIGHEKLDSKPQLIIQYCVNNLSSEVIHTDTSNIDTNKSIKENFTEYWDNLDENFTESWDNLDENDINYNKTDSEYKLFSIPLQVFNIRTRMVRIQLKQINDKSNNDADIVSGI